MAKKRKGGMFAPKPLLAMSAEEAQQSDYLFLNNAVFVQGFALAPAIGGARSLREAFVLALAGALLILPVRILGDLTVGVIKARVRIVFYALLAAALIVPDLILMSRLFGADVILLGFYLPLLFLDDVVVWRAGVPQREGFPLSLRGALLTALGYAASLCFLGALRELLAQGTLWGVSVFGAGVWPMAETVPGGLLIAALIAAAWQQATGWIKRWLYLGGQENG